MIAHESGKKRTFSLTRLDGLPVCLTEDSIRTLASLRGSGPHATELKLTGGETLLVKETVAEVLDACEAAEGKA